MNLKMASQLNVVSNSAPGRCWANAMPGEEIFRARLWSISALKNYCQDQRSSICWAIIEHNSHHTYQEEVRMTGLNALWLPILLSSVIVFIVSSIIHMLSPWHKGDYPKLSIEDKVLDALRPLDIPAGDYMMPRPSSRQEMGTPEFKEKFAKGPVVMMTVFPRGPMRMGGSMVMWFVYTVVIGIFAAYIAGRALPVGANYLQVFRFAGASAFLAYSAALWPMSIWYRRAWSITFKMTIDGLIYALLTAGTFGWLWPR